MPNISDYISSPDSYGIFNKGRWSRKARLADALSLVEQQKALDAAEKDAEMQRAIRQAKEIDTHQADIQKTRDEALGSYAEGDIKRMERDRARASLPSRMKRDEVEAGIGMDKSLAEQIMARQRLDRAPELGAKAIAREDAITDADIAKSNFTAENPGIAYQLDAMKALSQENLARELDRARNATAIKVAETRAGGDENPLLGDPFGGSKPGRLDLGKLKAAAEAASRPKPTEQFDTADPQYGILSQLLKEKFGYQLPQVAR